MGPAPSAPAKANLDVAIDAALISKGFRRRNLEADNFDDFILLAVEFTNKSDKNIRAFDGVLTFTDLLDNPIMSASLAVNDPIAAAAKYKWDGEIKYNGFKAEDVELRGADVRNMKMRLQVRKLLYADGKTEVSAK